jgi:hypothetical protein
MFTDGEPKFISHIHWCYAPKRLEVGDFFRISLKDNEKEVGTKPN